VEQEIWQYYQANAPGRVQVLGTDVFPSGTNGSLLAQFRINAGNLTFPLLRDCGDGNFASDTNLVKPYNQRDNYVVIDADGVIRYHADDAWDYGDRYHVNELRSAINAALADLLPVPLETRERMTLEVSPNPFTRRLGITFAIPAPGTSPARFRVFDLAGREVSCFDAPAGGSAATRIVWDARDASGAALAPGLYLLRLESSMGRLTRRIILAR